jgi:hypothetical protein
MVRKNFVEWLAMEVEARMWLGGGWLKPPCSRMIKLDGFYDFGLLV